MKKDILTRLDNYFDQKRPSENTLMFFGCAAIIVCIFYFLYFDPSEQFYDTEVGNHQSIDKELQTAKSFIASVSSPDGKDRNYKITQETSSLMRLNTQYENISRLNQYFDQKLKELSFLLFNEENWANFLDKVVLLAKENDVKILQLKNDVKAPSYQKIEQVLNIDLGFIGNYQNILNYINALEESKLVVDMHKVDLNITGTQLGTNLNISIWGMRY